MSQSLKADILSAIRNVIGSNDGKTIVLHEPTFDEVDKKFLNECLDSGFVSSVSPFVGKFEQGLAEYTGSPFVVACVNGTAALHICYRLSGVEPGDEVLMPALTFIATANAVMYCGAHPHFVDADPKTLGVDPHKLREYLAATTTLKNGNCINKTTGRAIKALVAVHVFGHASSVEELQAVCDDFGIRFIEDAAESLGSTYKGRSLGTFSNVAATSFNGNKVITTGGGGAIFCRDEKTAALAKHLTTTGKKPHAYLFEHDMLAYNYRLPGINAALGCAQLTRLKQSIVQKRKLADLYRTAFATVDGVAFVDEVPNSQSNFWLNAILLDQKSKDLRNEILEFTNQNGVMTRPIWTLMSRLPMYTSCPAMDLSASKDLEERIINIPSSPFLAQADRR